MCRNREMWEHKKCLKSQKLRAPQESIKKAREPTKLDLEIKSRFRNISKTSLNTKQKEKPSKKQTLTPRKTFTKPKPV